MSARRERRRTSVTRPYTATGVVPATLWAFTSWVFSARMWSGTQMWNSSEVASAPRGAPTRPSSGATVLGPSTAAASWVGSPAPPTASTATGPGSVPLGSGWSVTAFLSARWWRSRGERPVQAGKLLGDRRHNGVELIFQADDRLKRYGGSGVGGVAAAQLAQPR